MILSQRFRYFRSKTICFGQFIHLECKRLSQNMVDKIELLITKISSHWPMTDVRVLRNIFWIIFSWKAIESLSVLLLHV